MVINKDKLKARLKYQNVIEKDYTDGSEFLLFQIKPNIEGESIDLIVHKCDYSVFQIGWGNWHTHFDCFNNEYKNQLYALSFMKCIILQKLILIEYFNDSMQYYKGSVIPSNSFNQTHFVNEMGSLNTELSKSKIRCNIFNKEQYFIYL